MATTKYYITDTTNGYFIDWHSDVDELPINSNLQIFANIQKDSVYVGANTVVNARDLGDGVNKIYLTGNFDDYTQVRDLSKFTLTRKNTSAANNNLEQVSFVLDANNRLYFADGFLKLGLFDVGGILFSKDKLDNTEITPEHPAVFDDVNIGTTINKVFVDGADTGVNIPAGLKGSKITLSTNVKNDNVYVGANTVVNTTDLGDGVNNIYLTGNFDDYTQVRDFSKFTLTKKNTSAANNNLEQVSFVLDSNNRLYFADGFLKLGLFDVGGILFSKDKLDNSEVTPGLLIGLTITNDQNSVVSDVSQITYTFIFNKAVKDFTIEDINVMDGNASRADSAKGTFAPITGESNVKNGTKYTLVVTPSSNFDGNLIVSVDKDAANSKFNTAKSLAASHTQAVDLKGSTLATNPTITTTGGGNTKDDTVILTLTFDENVGGLISGNADDIFKVGAMAVSASWSGAQDTATRTLTYIVSTENGRVSIDADALKTALVAGIEKDAAGNSFAYAGAITISGTLPMVDTLAPSLITTDAIVANDVDDSSNYTADDTITFKFSESIQNVNLSDFSATGKTLNLGAGATTTVSGNDIVLKLGDAGLNLTTGDVLQLNKSAVLDAVNNTLADTGTIDFTLPGFMPATPLAESKINGVINIDVQTDIVLTFKGNVTAGDGHIELIDNNVGDPLNADGDWKRNADGIIVDENGNALDVNDITVEWETLGAAGVEDVDSAGNSVKGYGWIGDVYKNDIIFDANSVGTGAADGKNVAVTYTYDATTDSTLVVINPSRDLDFATDYKLVFGVGAFKYSGSSTISTLSEMSFSTVTPAANDTGQASKIMKNTDGTLEDSYVWFSAHQKFREGLPLEVDFGSIKGAWAVGLGNDSHPAYSSTRNNHGYLLLQNFLNDDLMYRDNSNGSKTLAGARIESTGDTENQNWVPGTDPEGSRISLSALRVELEGYFNIVADTVLENCLDEGRFIGQLSDIYKNGDFSAPADIHAPENSIIG